MLTRVVAGRLLLGIGVLGVLVGLGATVIGWQLVTHTGAALDRSLTLTTDTLEALQASVVVSEEAIEGIDQGLARLGGTTEALEADLRSGSEVVIQAADITEHGLADGLERFQDSLPALIQVATVIDRTLSGLSRVPFGPAYDPQEPFDHSLRQLQASLEGIPQDLRAQAVLVREAGHDLRRMGTGVGQLTGDIHTIREGLTGVAADLRGYTGTAVAGAELIAEVHDRLVFRVRLAQALVALLGLTIVLGQVIPLAIGWSLLRPPGETGLIRALDHSGR